MNQSDIQLRLYKAILLSGAGISVLCIIGNYISDFPLIISVKWAVLLVIAVTAYLFSRSGKYTEHIMFGVFVFLISIFLPFAFIDSGGSNNNATGYTFLLLISITYLFNGWRRIFLVAVLIAAFMVMHALEYYFPQFITEHSEWSQFVDRMIQIPMILLVSFLFILKYAKEYERVNRKLEEIASYDELTGLYNRRIFDKVTAEAAENDDELIHLALLDMDNFKNINDVYGHYIGDEVLKKLASLLKNNFGLGKHIVARWGGDEFAVIYYGEETDLNRKLEEVKKLFYEFVSSYDDKAGISTSIVSFRDYGEASKTIIAADKKLYKAKTKKSSVSRDVLSGNQENEYRTY